MRRQRLGTRGIALKFTIGLVLTMVMVISAMYIFSDIFSYESEAKGYESFAKLVTMMDHVNDQPEGTSDSVLIRLPRDWAILGFDGTALEAIRVLNNGLVVHKRAYMPEECRDFERCICLVKNLDVAATIYWERTLRCEDLGESGHNIPISHFANVGRTEYFAGDARATFAFMLKGGFAILQNEDDWTSIWEKGATTIEFSESHATSFADDILVQKIDGNRVSVCTNSETCSPPAIGRMYERQSRAREQYAELGRQWSALQTQHEAGITEQHPTDATAMMNAINTFLETRDYLYLTQYQQDTLFTRRHLGAHYGQQWQKATQYIDEAVRVVRTNSMRQPAQAAQTNYNCESRETLARCRMDPPICAWVQGDCERLQSIRIPNANCGDRENEADCLFTSPRLCRWRASVFNPGCEDMP